MIDAEAALFTVAAFLIGGFVKGAIGMGLPVVVLSLLVIVMPLREAMAVFLIPGVASNTWQAFNGPFLPVLFRRLWTFLLAAGVGILIGVTVLAGTKSEIMVAVMGAMLCIYSVYSLLTPRLPPPGPREGWMSPLFGGLGGVMFGMVGIFTVPGLLYLETLAMKRDQFVQALGLTFLTISVFLLVFMTSHALVTQELAMLSAIGLPPVFLGLWLGRRIRHRISEDFYRRLFFLSLIASGIYMMVRTLAPDLMT